MMIEGNQPYGTNPVTQRGGSGGNELGMDDFLSLMVAQLSNQDMYNTMDDTQFISQMAQFSMIQALADLSHMSSMTYSMNLIGKEALVMETNADGTVQVHQGIVEGVNLYNQEAVVLIEGRGYPISSVVEVNQPNMIIPKEGVGERD